MKFKWLSQRPKISMNPEDVKDSMGIVAIENIKAFKKLELKESEDNPDIIISFTHQGKFKPDTSGRIRIFYTTTTTHNSIIKEYIGPMRKTSETKNNFIFVSNKEMQENFKYCNIKTYIWNHGVNFNDFNYNPLINEGPFKFSFIGQGESWKRATFLTKCFLEAFNDNKEIAELKLLTGWSHIDGINLTDYKSISLESSKSKEELSLFLSNSDCFVTFSYTEGYCLPIIEALACGTPCLGVDMPTYYEKPYDILCEKIPSRTIVLPEILLGALFAPKELGKYRFPPYVYDVSKENAINYLIKILKKGKLRNPPLSHEYSWDGRIKAQCFPIIFNR